MNIELLVGISADKVNLTFESITKFVTEKISNLTNRLDFVIIQGKDS